MDKCSPGRLRTSVSAIDLSVASSRVTSSSGVQNTRKGLPFQVYIACGDFLQKNQKRPASVLDKIKYCNDCKSPSNLLYAFWCMKKKQWQILKPYPKGFKGVFQLCTHYMDSECGRLHCTFAHGQEELRIWRMQRQRGRYNIYILEKSIARFLLQYDTIQYNTIQYTNLFKVDYAGSGYPIFRAIGLC